MGTGPSDQPWGPGEDSTFCKAKQVLPGRIRLTWLQGPAAGGKQINMQEAWPSWLLQPQGALGLSWESVLDVPGKQG